MRTFRMKQKTFLANQQQGSALVFALIVLSIVLMSALSIAVATVSDRRSSSGTAKSTVAFQIADSGAEDVLGQFVSHDPADPVLVSDEINAVLDPDCDDEDNVYEGSVSGGSYRITFYSSDASGDTLLDCDTNQLQDIDYIKAVGEYQGFTRAIKVPFSTD